MFYKTHNKVVWLMWFMCYSKSAWSIVVLFRCVLLYIQQYMGYIIFFESLLNPSVVRAVRLCPHMCFTEVTALTLAGLPHRMLGLNKKTRKTLFDSQLPVLT